MLKKFYAWIADTDGFTGVEYALLAGFIGGAIVTGTFMFGDTFESMFTGLSTFFDSRTIS